MADMNMKRILLVQLIALALGLWSISPDNLHMEITARGDLFTLRANGKLLMENTIPGHPEGRIGLSLTACDSAQSVQFFNILHPQGWKNVVVKDLSTGKIIADDRDVRREIQKKKNADWYINFSGIITTRRGACLYFGDKRWKDFTLDIDFVNPYSGEIAVRVPDAGGGAVLLLRPFNNDSGWAGGGGAAIMVPPLLVIKQVLSRLFCVYLIACVIILALWAASIPVFFLCALIDLCRLGPILSWPLKLLGRPWAARLGRAGGILIIMLSAVIFLVLALWIMIDCHEKIPHIQDSSVYLFQAKMHANGWVYLPTPSFIDSVNFEFMVNRDGKWYGKYPPGHPLVLTLGILAERAYSLCSSSGASMRLLSPIDLLGGGTSPHMPLRWPPFPQSLCNVSQMDNYFAEIPWIEPPLLGFCSFLLLVAVAKKLYSFPVAVLSSLIAVGSPFFLFLAASFMSHITCLLALVIFLYLLLRLEEGGCKSYAFWAGFALGWAFITRQLSAVAIAAPWVAWQASRLFRRGRRWESVKRLIAIGLGAAIPFGFQLWYNYALTGDPLLPPFLACNPHDRIGFGDGVESNHSLGRGLSILENTFFYLLDNLFGWPHYLTLVFIIIPFILASEDRRDWLLLSSCVAISVAYIFYFARIRQHFGPRYWFEAMPAYIILSARGIVTVSRSCGALAEWLRRAFGRPRYVATWPQVIATVPLMLFLAWLMRGYFQGYFPRLMREHHCYNDIDARIPMMVKEHKVHNAIVFVNPEGQWQNYGSVFALNSPRFDSDVIYVKALGREKNQKVLDAFPGRSCYFTDYQKRELRAMSEEGEKEEGEEEYPLDETTGVSDEEIGNEGT